MRPALVVIRGSEDEGGSGIADGLAAHGERGQLERRVPYEEAGQEPCLQDGSQPFRLHGERLGHGALKSWLPTRPLGSQESGMA